MSQSEPAAMHETADETREKLQVNFPEQFELNDAEFAASLFHDKGIEVIDGAVSLFEGLGCISQPGVRIRFRQLMIVVKIGESLSVGDNAEPFRIRKHG